MHYRKLNFSKKNARLTRLTRPTRLTRLTRQTRQKIEYSMWIVGVEANILNNSFCHHNQKEHQILQVHVQFVWCELYKACFNVCSLKCAVCNGLLGQDIPKRRSTNLSLYPGQSSLPSFYLLDFKSAPTKRIEPFSILPICLHWVRWWGHFQNNQTFYNTIYLPAK